MTTIGSVAVDGYYLTPNNGRIDLQGASRSPVSI